MKYNIKIILSLILVLFLVGCEKGYENVDEALNQSYNGDARTLNFCNVYVNMNSTNNLNNYIGFTFLGITEKEKDSCRQIQNDCLEHKKYCKWIVEKSAQSSGLNNKWYPKYTGSCVCSVS